ncbi:nitrate transporter 1.1-like isoform X1 [Hibiscus syriacus]|uniref:Nitrate transporter 1.1-like isoform X1 n=1 Tax=Hibiscus syriacus TaxID=106335 RepID=A0A6A2XTN9_HIBSY|nr:nitrate transporter 1.1-like isoform X1 [Hibiscus syriacus]
MASGWVKSLQCKSRAYEDVYRPSPKHLIPSTSCARSSQSIKDVIETAKKKPKKSDPKSNPKPYSRSSSKSESELNIPPPRPCRSTSLPARPLRNTDPVLPALTELPEGHTSRNVVEIIFHTSWSPKAFTGRIEMVFKVQNGPRTVSRFEEYREVVKTRSGSGSGSGDSASADEENARCFADGNEVMRFHCLGSSSGNYGMNDKWLFSGGKGAAICTYSGSGGGHDSAGGGKGRKAMLVCRLSLSSLEAGGVRVRAVGGRESRV